MRDSTQYCWEKKLNPDAMRAAINCLEHRSDGSYASRCGRFTISRFSLHAAGWDVTDNEEGGAARWFPILGEAALVVQRLTSRGEIP